mmetsp:Transcript_31034/g.104481  ORF Transcript_31034/g.104481 Transcript_31034/m.104481 type:complete len:512 (-) Transcript_31034:1641-3176(-)
MARFAPLRVPGLDGRLHLRRRVRRSVLLRDGRQGSCALRGRRLFRRDRRRRRQLDGQRRRGRGRRAHRCPRGRRNRLRGGRLGGREFARMEFSWGPRRRGGGARVRRARPAHCDEAVLEARARRLRPRGVLVAGAGRRGGGEREAAHGSGRGRRFCGVRVRARGAPRGHRRRRPLRAARPRRRRCHLRLAQRAHARIGQLGGRVSHFESVHSLLKSVPRPRRGRLRPSHPQSPHHAPHPRAAEALRRHRRGPGRDAARFGGDARPLPRPRVGQLGGGAGLCAGAGVAGARQGERGSRRHWRRGLALARRAVGHKSETGLPEFEGRRRVGEQSPRQPHRVRQRLYVRRRHHRSDSLPERHDRRRGGPRRRRPRGDALGTDVPDFKCRRRSEEGRRNRLWCLRATGHGAGDGAGPAVWQGGSALPPHLLYGRGHSPRRSRLALHGRGARPPHRAPPRRRRGHQGRAPGAVGPTRPAESARRVHRRQRGSGVQRGDRHGRARCCDWARLGRPRF